MAVVLAVDVKKRKPASPFLAAARKLAMFCADKVARIGRGVSVFEWGFTLNPDEVKSSNMKNAPTPNVN